MLDSGRLASGQPLTFELERDGEVFVIRPVGELDISTTHALDAELRGALKGNGTEVLLDLGELTFIDSSGLQFLLLVTGYAHANGDRLRMLRGSGPLEHTMNLGGLEHSLPFID